MELVNKTIEARKTFLRQSALCTYIGDGNVAPSQRLSFVPAMIFFTMGFKDILAALCDEDDDSPLQQSVHQHCMEDSFHWQWYLEDLATIEHGQRLINAPIVHAFTDVWSPANHATREVVYHAIHLAKTYRTPYFRMVIIEALEATFACFNEPMYRLVREMGMAEQLHYFGQVHEHAESSHSKDQEDTMPEYEPDEIEAASAVHLANELFDVFEDMFDCWYRARENESLPLAA